MTTSNIETAQIPGTDLKPSRIGLGTWAIGGWMWGGTDDAQSIRTIQAAVDRGITLIDTAPVYGFGRSEEIVGRGACRRRTAQEGRHRHQGRARLERRKAVPQRQPRTHHERDRRFTAPAAHRRYRSLSSALARPERTDRGNRRRDGRSAQGRKNPRHRGEQFHAGADGQVSRGRSARHRPTALQSVRARDRARHAALLPAQRNRDARLWRALPRTCWQAR